MTDDYTLSAYDYDLPAENIAQVPADRRDQSRLLLLDNITKYTEHKQFSDILDYLQPEDVLVINDTKVFPARLQGRKVSGGKAEVFLLDLPNEVHGSPGRATATALIKSSKRPRPGTTILLDDELHCEIHALLPDGKANIILHYPTNASLTALLDQQGQVPLPPYIHRPDGSDSQDLQRYQTVYANQPGAVAAPTAGLHFTDELLARIASKGVTITSITLHVGYGTFAPVRVEAIREHRIHGEYISVKRDTVAKIAAAKERGGKVWAVGTTTVRALEFAAASGELQATEGWCDLYIVPGYRFQVIDNMLTNFHLPCSSLMFLVAALCGRETLLACYREAVQRGYRFYSYGDAMAILAGDHGR